MVYSEAYSTGSKSTVKKLDGVSAVNDLPVDNGFNLFPNPTQNELWITSNCKITSASVVNLLGEKVISTIGNSEKVQMDITDLPTGIYILKINETEVRRFVKQ